MKGIGFLKGTRFESQTHQTPILCSFQEQAGFSVSCWQTPYYYSSYKIHGTGIFTYIWLKFMVNVGKYTSPMDPLGFFTPFDHFIVVSMDGR